MIRRCTDDDFAGILEIINQAAQAYRGVIPSDCWHEPYMPAEHLRDEIHAGVAFYGFYGCQGDKRLLGVMGIQDKQDVALIRHAYVLPACQRQGIGSKLLEHLCGLSQKPVLVGTWASAAWAIEFYQHHGFQLVTPAEKDTLLRRYWNIPDRQVQTSVVLVDSRCLDLIRAGRSGQQG